jgi:hypothetical protein
MSLSTADENFDEAFANVVVMVNLPDISRAPALILERCFVTNTICYTHRQAHWTNTVEKGQDCKPKL